MQGPGCINFTLILAKELRPEIESIHGSYDYILGHIVRSIGVPGLQRAGISDIALGELKVSGSAQRRNKDFVLHHGTLLYDANIPFISSLIREPAGRPEYRGSRTHEAFVKNLEFSRLELMNCVSTAFGVGSDFLELNPNLLAKSEGLAEEKYRLQSWIYRK